MPATSLRDKHSTWGVQKLLLYRAKRLEGLWFCRTGGACAQSASLESIFGPDVPKTRVWRSSSMLARPQICLEGEGGCLRSPPPLQTSPPPLSRASRATGTALREPGRFQGAMELSFDQSLPATVEKARHPGKRPCLGLPHCGRGQMPLVSLTSLALVRATRPGEKPCFRQRSPENLGPGPPLQKWPPHASSLAVGWPKMAHHEGVPRMRSRTRNFPYFLVLGPLKCISRA